MSQLPSHHSYSGEITMTKITFETKDTNSTYLTESDFAAILRDELDMALGCTEPIAIAYCAAKARRILGETPDSCEIEVSGNIIKNAKSVVVPGTDGMKGIPAAAAAGIVAGDPSKKLEVIAGIDDIDRKNIRDYLSHTPVTISASRNAEKLYIRIILTSGINSSEVIIARHHTNIIFEKRNDEVLLDTGFVLGVDESGRADDNIAAKKALLTVENILNYAKHADLTPVRETLERQIACNSAIAKEGLRNNWGANIGSTMLATGGNTVRNRAQAYAAAGSDARMSGCELPVVINSGSGNQGITVTMPVITYAKELGVSHDTKLRALLISNLISVHIKYGIGALSAFCGAVSAGCAAGCGIAFLYGADYDVISKTLSNSLAIASGIICDGAKPSCAAKIALSVNAGIMGFEMCQFGQMFHGGDGILASDIEDTIDNVSGLGSEGMQATDQTILRIMTK